MRLVICGGGTGGHIYPALGVVEALRKRGLMNDQVLWIGTHGQMEEDLVRWAGLPLKTIAGGPIAGVPRMTQLRNGAKLAMSVMNASRIIKNFKPDVLFLTGGYVNLPVAAAARLNKVPAAVFLPDVEPGAAIKRIEPLVEKIGCSVEDSAEYLPQSKLVPTGYPVRDGLRSVVKEMSKAEARATFDLDPESKTLFVFGGSRGAQSINQALMAILPQLLAEMQVIHVSGKLTWPEVEAFAETLAPELRARYRPEPYLYHEMGAAFRAADLIVARAGASMLGEGPAFGLPAILVPYPHAWRYQKINADYLADRGAGVRLDDEKMAAELLPTILDILRNPQRLQEMQAAAAQLDKPDAAVHLAYMLESLANRVPQ